MNTRFFALFVVTLVALPTLVHAQLGPGGMCYEIAHGTCSRNDCDYCLTELGSVGKGKKGVGMTYVNTYTQSGGQHGACTDCSFASQTGTAREYNEQVPAYSVHNYPNGPEWQYLARQLQKAKQSGAQVIDLDNVDAYSRDVVIKMYDLAGSAGLKVLAKNVFDPALLKHGAVAGGLYEPEGDAVTHVQKIAAAIAGMGNKNLPVFVIEHDEQNAKKVTEAMAKAGLNGGSTWSGGSAYTTTAGVTPVGNGGIYTPTGQFASVQNPDEYFRGLDAARPTGGVFGTTGTLGNLFSSIAGANPGNGGMLSTLLRSVGIGGGGTSGGASGTSSASPSRTSIPVLATLLGNTITNPANTLATATETTAQVSCTTERTVWRCGTGANTARITTSENKTINTQGALSGDIFIALSAGETLSLKCFLGTQVLAEDSCTAITPPIENTYTDPQYSYTNDTRIIRKKVRACQL